MKNSKQNNKLGVDRSDKLKADKSNKKHTESKSTESKSMSSHQAGRKSDSKRGAKNSERAKKG